MTAALAVPAAARLRVPRRPGLRLPLVALGALLAVLAYASHAGHPHARGVPSHRSVAPTHGPSLVFGDHPIRHPATLPAHPF